VIRVKIINKKVKSKKYIYEFRCYFDIESMSSKKVNNGGGNAVEVKTKSNQQRNKNRRRSTRNTSFSNGDTESDNKGLTKKSRDSNNIKYESSFDQDDAYKDIIDVVPSADLNCSPAETPAPPGTRVNLHGVILHETQGGLIVLNVRWRNKVYSGALIDVEKSKWASDRVQSPECNGNSKEFQSPPPIKKLKIPTSSSNINDDNNEKKKLVTSPTTPSKNSKSRTNGKKRNIQDRDTSPPLNVEDVPSKKHKSKPSVATQNGSINNTINNDGLIECPEPNCNKKYKNKYGLTCHIRKVHNKSESLDESGKENKSESQEDSDSGDDNFVIDERPDEDRSSKESMDGEKTAEEGSEEGEDEPQNKEDMTENEKQIEKLKLETEKVREAIKLFKKESPDEEKPPPMEKSFEEKQPTVEGQQEKEVVVKIEELSSTEGAADEEMKIESKAINEEEQNENTPLQTPSIEISQSSPSDATKTDLIADVKSESDSENHPRGHSRTIIHQDHMNSLNELFAPANNNFHQFSPTLGSLNPQQINESLTEALSKQQQQQQKAKSNLTLGNASTLTTDNTISTDVIKTPLAPKPSIDFKPVDTQDTDAEKRKKFPVPELINQRGITQVSLSAPTVLPSIAEASEKIDCSDDERSNSPHLILKDCTKVYPQNDQDVKPIKMLLAKEMTNPTLRSLFANPRQLNPFEQKLLLEDFANKVSSNMNSFNNMASNNAPVSSGKLPPNVPPNIATNMLKGLFKISNMDTNNIPDMLNLLKQPNSSIPFRNPAANKDEGLKTLGSSDGSSISFIQSLHEGQQLKPGSLLEQRLLSQNTKFDIGTNLSKNLFLSRQQEIDNDGLKSDSLQSGKDSPKSMFMTRDRSYDKQKLPLGGLRINPPTSSEEKCINNTRTWIPEISKDTYFNGPASSGANFRLPVTKSLSAGPSLSANNLAGDIKNAKSLASLKRPMQPVPIAPAPGPNLPSQFLPTSSEFISPESEKEASQFSRYTLTSDNRLIPSPAENRGRPRKVRGKLQQIPLATTQDTASAKLRSPGEMGLSRKPSSSPVIRASVIQGASNPLLDGMASLMKSPERENQHQMLGPTRSFDVSMEERFLASLGGGSLGGGGSSAHHHMEGAKLAAEMQRNMTSQDKYKALSSPPGMFYNPVPPRSIISPHNARPSSRSPRPEYPISRSSPGVNPEMLRDPMFQHRTIDRLDKLLLNEHAARQTPELMRSPTEHILMPDGTRKTTLSPQEAFQMMEAYKRETRDRGGGGPRFQMPPNHRPDITHAHENSLHERREESEHARLMAAREHERLIHQAQLASGLYRGTTPPNIPSSVEQGGHHPNLFLERRNGAFLGPLSSFQTRPGEQHKR